MTQPVMYEMIDSLPSTLEVYTSNLVGRGDITIEEARTVTDEFELSSARFLRRRVRVAGFPIHQKGPIPTSKTASKSGMA